MKRLLIIIPPLLMLGIWSCKNDTSNTPEHNQPAQIKGAALSDNVISFKVNGELVQTTGWNISRFTMGKTVQLNITTNMHQDKRTIMMNVKSDKPGSYDLGDGGHAYGDYKPDYDDLLNSYSFQDGKIEILKIDTTANTLQAIFEGTVKTLDGKSLRITEGRITNGKLTPGINTY